MRGSDIKEGDVTNARVYEHEITGDSSTKII